MKKGIALLLCLALCLAFVSGSTAQEAIDYAVGSLVTFGACEQDNNMENGRESIEWIVLDTEGTKVFLISQYCLAAHAFHTEKIPMTWEKCDLRKWLNSEFLNDVFTLDEQAMIAFSAVVNDNNPDYQTYGGRDTVDQIYLLSYNELFQYFPQQDSRTCAPTAYATEQGAYVNGINGNTYWWLRTPGVRPVDVCGVSANGILSGYGSRDVNRRSGTVRPVIWVDFGK